MNFERNLNNSCHTEIVGLATCLPHSPHPHTPPQRIHDRESYGIHVRDCHGFSHDSEMRHATSHQKRENGRLPHWRTCSISRSHPCHSAHSSFLLHLYVIVIHIHNRTYICMYVCTHVCMHTLASHSQGTPVMGSILEDVRERPAD